MLIRINYTKLITKTHCSWIILIKIHWNLIGFEESRQDRIILQDIDGGALQLLIDYVYSAEVLVTEENVQVNKNYHYQAYNNR